MPYTYRTVKGSPLTHAEYDENFAYTETLMKETETARDAAVSAGNFQGRWSDQHGSVAPPYAVAHNGRTWALNVELFDVTASEPSEANADWTLLLGTAASKNVGTGPEEVPLNSSLGTAASKNTGTAPGDVPLNSDLSSLLGTAANEDIGTSGANVPLLSNANDWGGNQTVNGNITSSTGNVVSRSSGNRRYWFLNEAGLETGLIWHDPVANTLNMRHRSTPGGTIVNTLQLGPGAGELRLNGNPVGGGAAAGTIRAWCTYDGTTILASGNISHTQLSGSNTYFYFITPMPDNNYACTLNTIAKTTTYVMIPNAETPYSFIIVR